MGPFDQLSPIGRAPTFVINRNQLSKYNYSYIYPTNGGRQVFLQTYVTQLHIISIFSFISQNGPFRTVIPYWPCSKLRYQQKSLI